MTRPFLRSGVLALGLSAVLGAVSVVLGLAPVENLAIDVSAVQLASVPELGNESVDEYDSLAATILSRPLFVKGRQASGGAEGAGTTIGEYRLAGTIANSRVKKALFHELAGESEGKQGLWVGIGDEVSGWRIVAVEPGKAVLRRGQEEVTLSISKRKALTPKQVSQLRAATPIQPSERTNIGKAASQTRAEQLKEALSGLDEGDFYGTPN